MLTEYSSSTEGPTQTILLSKRQRPPVRATLHADAGKECQARANPEGRMRSNMAASTTIVSVPSTGLA